MNLAEWLRSIFAPCPHEYETISTLKDREENPTAATIIQACRHCGAIRDHTIRAPEGTECKHRWTRVGSTRLMPSEEQVKAGLVGRDREGNVLPVDFIDLYQCIHCGEPMERMRGAIPKEDKR